MTDRPVQPDPDAPWHCALCGVHYPIPSLARDCEHRHLTDDTTDAEPRGE